MNFSKKTAAKIKTAIIAYKAYHDALTEGDDNGRKVWARVMRDHAKVYEAVGLDVREAINRIISEDAAHLGETVAEYNARRCREMFGE